MLYLVCPVVLLLVCLGSSLVDAFLSGSRLVIQNSNTAVVSGKSALNRLTIGHCKSCPCASCLRENIGSGSSTSLKASSVGITMSRRISANGAICNGRSSCTCAACGACSGKNSCSCSSCSRSGARLNRNSKVVTCQVCNFAICGCSDESHRGN